MAERPGESDISTIATKISHLVQRFRWPLLLVYSLTYWNSLLPLAGERLFWYDELFTYYVAQLPGYGAIWNGLIAGADNHPPLGYWAVHFAQSVAGKSEWATRLPAIAAFWLSTLLLYWIVARATDAVHGFIAMLLPILTMGIYFAYEARGYALAMMFSAAAVLFWQLAKTGTGRPWTTALVGLSLAGACYSHYYGVLLLVPFSLAELAWSAGRKKVDWGIWLSLGAGLASMMPMLPLMGSSSRFAATFWSPYRGAWPVTKAYFDLWWKPMVIVGLVSLAADQLIGPATAPEDSSKEPDIMLTKSGGLLTAGYALIPGACLVLAYAVTHAFTARYIIFSVTGVIVALVAGFYRRYHHAPAAGLALLTLTAAAAFVEVHVRRERLEEQSTEQPLSAVTGDLVETLAQLEATSSEPVLLGEQLFLPGWHYSSPAMRSRLGWLVEEEQSHWAIAARGLAPIEKMPVVTLEEAARKYPRFYLYRPGSGIMTQLKGKGYRFEAGNRVLLLAIRRTGEGQAKGDLD